MIRMQSKKLWNIHRETVSEQLKAITTCLDSEKFTQLAGCSTWADVSCKAICLVYQRLAKDLEYSTLFLPTLGAKLLITNK